jgi:hypothetical protein
VQEGGNRFVFVGPVFERQSGDRQQMGDVGNGSALSQLSRMGSFRVDESVSEPRIVVGHVVLDLGL